MTRHREEEARANLRARLLADRLTLSVPARRHASNALAHVLLSARNWSHQILGVYAAIDGEIDLCPFLRALPPSTQLAWPLCKPNRVMEFRVANYAELIPGKYGILEPKNGALLAPEAMDAMLIPGSAFSLEGGRLGMGGGYYDRYLTRVRKEIPKIGVAYDWQIQETLPLLPHDIPMTHLATDRAWLPCAPSAP